MRIRHAAVALCLFLLPLALLSKGSLLAAKGSRAALAVELYLPNDLGVLAAGDNSCAYDKNAAGQVVGWSGVSDYFRTAFIWRDGTMTSLGVLPGDSVSWAHGINDAGQVVGTSAERQEWLLFNHAFFLDDPWDPTVEMVPIDGLADDSWAFAISDPQSGEPLRVVGRVCPPSGCTAAVWEDGVLTPIGTPSSNYALDVNNQGQVVGGGYWPYGPPFIWKGGVTTVLETLGGVWGQATAINEPGQVVGYTETTDVVEAFNSWRAALWEAGAITDLGTLPGDNFSEAHGINAARQVVGRSGPDFVNSGMAHAFIWQDGEMRGLPTLDGDWGWSEAYAIDDSGVIVGCSWKGGQRRATAWAPTSASVAIRVYLIGRVEALVANGTLSRGQGSSLTAKLEAAAGLLADMVAQNDVAAVNALQAFVGDVERLVKHGVLPPAQGNQLLNLASLIVDAIPDH